MARSETEIRDLLWVFGVARMPVIRAYKYQKLATVSTLLVEEYLLACVSYP